MATQHDIARETGLSQTTISRVLRGDSAVTEETRLKVVNACSTLGYRPSIGARMLVRGRSAIVGLSLSARALPTDRYVSLLHQSLVLELSSSGWGTRLVTPEEFENQLEEIGAIVLIGVSPHDPRIDACRKARLPLAVIGYPADSTVPSVIPDDAGGARLAIEYLVSNGRRKLMMLSSLTASGGDPALKVRRDSALATAAALGVPISVIEANNDASSTLAGYRAIFHTRSQLSDVDGLFCDRDEHAQGAVAALKDRGISVPENVSVIGFDDIPGFSSTLTTIKQDFQTIARSAIDLCRASVDTSNQYMDMPHVVPVQLIVKQT